MSLVMTNFKRSSIIDNLNIPVGNGLIINQDQVPTNPLIMYQYIGKDSVHAFTDKEREGFRKNKSTLKKSNNTSTLKNKQSQSKFNVNQLNWKDYKNSKLKKSLLSKYPRYSDERAKSLISEGYLYNSLYKVFYKVLPNGYIQYQYK